MSSEQLEKEFVSSFILRDVINCVYIVKVEAIHGPLFVFNSLISIGPYMAHRLFWASFKLNSLTAMGVHGCPHFNELRTTVVSCRIIIRLQSLIAR